MSQRIGQFSLGSEIGRGSFANVYRGQDTRTARAVAIKAVVRNRLKNQKLIDNLEIEINILKTMRNPHIVSLMDCIKTDDYIYLVMEYCALGDLSYFIRKRDQLKITHPIVRSVLERYPSPEGSNGLNNTLIVNFIKQLASALEFLRSQNLVHRDIKPQNLLLLPPAHTKADFEAKHYAGFWELPVLKIADFGFARFLPSTSMAETLCGSPLYMAPEILRYEKYNAKADLWSVGTVIYEMTVGKPPFRAANHVELLRKIEKAKDEISFPPNVEINEGIIRMICSLLKANPTERMGFNEFFNDPLVINDDFGAIDKPLDCDLNDDQMFISEYLQLPESLKQVQPPQAKQTSPSSKINIPERVDEEEATDLTTSDDVHSTLEQSRVDIARENTPLGPVGPLETSIPNKVDELLNAHRKKQGTQGAQGPQEAHAANPLQNSVAPVEREYVVVDKGTVEINSLADDISRGPPGPSSVPKPSIPRSYATMGSGLTRGYSFTRRKSSVGTNGSSGASVGSNPLREVLDYTHEKIFGGYAGSSVGSGGSVNSGDATILKRNTSATIINKLISARPLKASPTTDIISKLEILATMAHSVSIFAEVKFVQLIPLPPSAERMSDPFSSSGMEALKFNEKLPTMQVRAVGREGLSLYVKVLGILAEAMKLAGDWWKANPLNVQVNSELNELVQWIRNRFNESFERAEFLRLKLSELESDRQGGSSGAPSVAEPQLGNKLIFDRALEMSRGAALNELKGEDLEGCERCYATSIWMLESLLHDGLESEDDKHTVQTFVDSIGNRLLVLRSKLATRVSSSATGTTGGNDSTIANL